MSKENNIADEIKMRVKVLLEKKHLAEQWYGLYRNELTTAHNRHLESIEAETIISLESINNEFKKAQLDLERAEQLLREAYGNIIDPWNSPSWEHWQPAIPSKNTTTRQAVLRIGELSDIQGWDMDRSANEAETQSAGPEFVEIIQNAQSDFCSAGNHYALLSLGKMKSILLKTPREKKNDAIVGMQSMILRLLTCFPPGKLRITFIDPIGLGQNAAPFLKLADFDENLVTGRVWTESDHINQRLIDTTEHIENMIQKYLRNEYTCIEDYNEHAGEIAEPYRVLVVFDFPEKFSVEMAQRLVSIAQNGSRCGVITIIQTNNDKALPYDFDLSDLEKSSVIISAKNNIYSLQDQEYRNYNLSFDPPPQSSLFNEIIQKIGDKVKLNTQVRVPFENILERIGLETPSKWWMDSTKDDIVVPLGPSGARKLQSLELGKGTTQHALIAGRVGSGKTTLLHVLITNIALKYSPDEIELYLVDFKQGVEFKIYTLDEYRLAHARVVAIESEREFGLSVLQGLEAELERRGNLFRASTEQTGKRVENISDYRDTTGKKLPRILLIVDEFHVFFEEDDLINSQSARILDTLVRQGRAAGIHVILGSQTLAGAYSLTRSTVDQMAVRIALQSSESDSRLILADDNPAARLLSRPGEAIYNSANGLIEGNNYFQVAWLPDETLNHVLEELRGKAQKTEMDRSQIVFEGNAPSKIENNIQLRNLLATPRSNGDTFSPLCVWLGDPVTINDPTAAIFHRASGNNLLIVGKNEESATALISSALVSLSCQIESQRKSFYVLDFSIPDSFSSEVFNNVINALPEKVEVGKRRQLIPILTEIQTEIENRLELETGSKSPTIFLFICGLQRARDLRQDYINSDFSLDEVSTQSPISLLGKILRDGPDVGVHTMIWCDTYTNLDRSIDRGLLREFAMRVIYQASAEDSSILIDNSSASKLGANRALFYDEDSGGLEKFRPYSLPTETWIGQVKSRFSS